MVRRPSLRHALAASLRRLRRRAESGLPAGEAGNIMIMMGLATVVLFGIMGLAIDVGRLYATKAELSRAVDAAALAGVLEFDGTSTGLTNAQLRAEAYLVENEPGLDCPGDECYVFADGGQNRLTVDATKSVKMFFLSVFGIDSASVDGHAVAGFNNQTIDAVLILDATGSMSGSPISNAKTAAINFKNVLLGTSPSGNVVVGVTPFRGCFRRSPQNAIAPKPMASTTCVDYAAQTTYMTSNSSTLTTRINAITATGGSGTNVCGGLYMGLDILNGPNKHTDPVLYPNNSRYMILLSDGDNTYNNYSYQSATPGPLSPYSSCIPTTTPENDDTYVDSNCRSAQTRERQIDTKTWTLAKSIESQGIEIFVVGFGVCDPDSSPVYTQAQCDSWIGNTNHDDTADERLLKCIASSDAGTNDHYYWASSASALPAIFSTIAAQIAHRLIE
ncbi:MAG TPA: TadE/TadG family type IV pilus assembly protein [Dehalococcoidia bacterium]